MIGSVEDLRSFGPLKTFGRLDELPDQLDVIAHVDRHAHLEGLFGLEALGQGVDLRVVLLEPRYHLTEHGDVDVLVRVEGRADDIRLSSGHDDAVEVAFCVLEGQRRVDEGGGAIYLDVGTDIQNDS
jgi:hypothetical protein